jgi:hypothetical protein
MWTSSSEPVIKKTRNDSMRASCCSLVFLGLLRFCVAFVHEAKLSNETARVSLSAVCPKMSHMSESKKVGPALIVSVLREAKRPLTTKELSLEVHRRVPRCVSDNIVVLNMMRISGRIKGKHVDDSWVWWVEDKRESK